MSKISFFYELLFLSVVFPLLTYAQQPFVCTGDFYLSLTDFGNSTQFYSVNIDPVSGGATFNALTNNSGTSLNAIAYRSSDNLIYAINPGTNQLVQVDATGRVFPLVNLNLDTNYGYFGADISPDGNTFIATGNNNSGTRVLVGIDLNDPTYPVLFSRNLNTSSTIVSCTDIAFNPIDERLYAFDSNNHRLVEIDPATGIVDITTFPVTNVAERMGALFFNAFGELFGYGNDFVSNAATDLYQLDIETGEVTLRAQGPAAPGKDGCSCPYTILLKKTVSQTVAFPCTEVLYSFEITNQSANQVSGIDFLDEMPAGLTIMEIIENPFGGEVITGVGGNILKINNMTVLGGINELVVRVRIDENVVGTLENQAILTNLPPALGESTISDNPNTVAQSDPTILQVVPLFVDLENQQAQICEGESITLIGGKIAGVDYLWSDGSTGRTLDVDSAGVYSVVVDSGCEIVFDTVTITSNSLTLELGADREIGLGDSILLIPNISATGNTLNYFWLDSLQNSLSCDRCEQPSARPFFDTEISLVINDENGCTAQDVLRITVDKTRATYVATAFSPNGDGVNDFFYLQGRGQIIINQLQIFDRWGNQVFMHKNGLLNDKSSGWDGTFKQKLLNPAVFVWVAELEYLDGIVEQVSGEITLVR